MLNINIIMLNIFAITCFFFVFKHCSMKSKYIIWVPAGLFEMDKSPTPPFPLPSFSPFRHPFSTLPHPLNPAKESGERCRSSAQLRPQRCLGTFWTRETCLGQQLWFFLCRQNVVTETNLAFISYTGQVLPLPRPPGVVPVHHGIYSEPSLIHYSDVSAWEHEAAQGN